MLTVELEGEEHTRQEYGVEVEPAPPVTPARTLLLRRLLDPPSLLLRLQIDASTWLLNRIYSVTWPNYYEADESVEVDAVKIVEAPEEAPEEASHLESPLVIVER